MSTNPVSSVFVYPRPTIWAIAAIATIAASTASVTPAYAAERLDDDTIVRRLSAIPSWTLNGPTLICTYEFEGFVESVEFVNQLVAPAEALGHHPDLTISYDQVRIELTTHDASGLTTLDFDLAEQIRALSDRPCQS